LVAVLMAVGSDKGTRLAKKPSQWLFGGCFRPRSVEYRETFPGERA
jgi:hypothetical protein